MCQTVWHTFRVTFLSVTNHVCMHVRTYILFENRSSIQSLTLMRSAISPKWLYWTHSYLWSVLHVFMKLYSACGHQGVSATFTPEPLAATVEPLYNGHFGTSHFWIIFAVIQRFSSFRGKNVLAWWHWDRKTCP